MAKTSVHLPTGSGEGVIPFSIFNTTFNLLIFGLKFKQ